MDTAQRVQKLLTELQAEVNGEIKARLNVNRMDGEQKLELFRTIRYSYLPHEKLLELSSDAEFEPARDLIIQALSVRLQPYEEIDQSALKINLEPRALYKVDDFFAGPSGSLRTPPGETLASKVTRGAYNKTATGMGNKPLTSEQQQALNHQMLKNPYLKRSNYGTNFYEKKLEDERMRASAWNNTYNGRYLQQAAGGQAHLAQTTY